MKSQFFRFAQVGAVCFFVDWGVLTLLLSLGSDFLVGRAISYVSAATVAWLLNRTWTFKRGEGRLFVEWLKFLLANAVGGTLNYGVSVFLAITQPELISNFPVIAVAAGSVSGLVVNFLLSRWLVFRD